MSVWKNIEIDFKSTDGSVTKFYIEESIDAKNKKEYTVMEVEEVTPSIKEEKQ